jgi:phosphoribosylformylglycinamidine cyclo-ligase
VFELLRKIGNVPEDDYRRTFNLGVGMIVAVSRRHKDATFELLKEIRQKAFVIGEVVSKKEASAQSVIYE